MTPMSGPEKMTQKTSKKGGARPGAGRPKKSVGRDIVQVKLHIYADQRETLKNLGGSDWLQKTLDRLGNLEDRMSKVTSKQVTILKNCTAVFIPADATLEQSDKALRDAGLAGVKLEAAIEYIDGPHSADIIPGTWLFGEAHEN